VEIFLSPQIFELYLTVDLIGLTPAKVEREELMKGRTDKKTNIKNQ
jgi:hypothetical protein